MMKRDIRPIENTNNGDSTKLDEQIRIQNEGYFEIYDYIAKNVPKHNQIMILNANGQAVPDSDAQVNGIILTCKFEIENNSVIFILFSLDSSPFDRCDLLWCITNMQNL